MDSVADVSSTGVIAVFFGVLEWPHEAKKWAGDHSGYPKESNMSNADLDEQAIAQLRSLDTAGTGDIFQRLVEAFLNDTQRQLISLQAACGQGQFKDVARVAHTIKGSGGNFGARHLAELCIALETAALNGDQSAVTSAMQQVMEEFDLVRMALESMSDIGPIH